MAVIEQKIEDGILILTLNRPEKLNALNHEMLELLSSILTDAKCNDAVKGVLITGNGKAFCAGADISKLAECDANSGYEFAKYGQEVFKQLTTLGKPSLAAVNGFAFGGGCELAIAATLRIAADVAKFSQPEVKLGVIPGYGGTQRLARLIGKGRALDMCLTGRFIDAKTAENYGLVSQVVDSHDLGQEAIRILKEITALAPLAIAAIIEAIDIGYDLPLEEALKFEALHFAKTCSSQDKKEGVAAFLEKRMPKFIGA